MKRGFLLILGSVALAIVGAGAELGPGYPRSAQADPLQLQYLPGAVPAEEPGARRRSGQRVRGGSRPGVKDTPARPAPPLPNEFARSYDGEAGAVPGEPGVDYPTYSAVPATSFSCEGRIAGYYADPETRCQIFHVCTAGGSTSNSFLCPNGTLFNPAVATCDWWPAVDCGSSSESLRINKNEQPTRDIPPTTSSLGGRIGAKTQSQRDRIPESQPQYTSFNERFPQKESSSVSVTKGFEEDHGEVEQYQNYPTLTNFHSSNTVEQPYVQLTPQPIKSTQATENREFYRRRPKPFSGSQRFYKQQQARLTTTEAPLNIYRDQEEVDTTESHFVNPVTVRTTPAPRRDKSTTRAHTITRFDFTSETLEFPSMRIVPTKSSYTINNEHLRPSSRRPSTRTPVRTASATFGSPSYANKDEDITHPLQRPSDSPSYNERRNKYKASRLVTQAPSSTERSVPNYPETVRISASIPSKHSYDSNYTPTRNPIRVTPRIPLLSTATTPKGDVIFDFPKSTGQTFRYTASTTPQAPVTEEVARPIIVTSPGNDYSLSAISNANTFAQYNSGQLHGKIPTADDSRFTTANAQSFSQSSFPDTQPSNGISGFTSSETIQSLAPTQETSLFPRYNTQSNQQTKPGNTQSFPPTQDSTLDQQYVTEKREPLITEGKETYTPTPGTFTTIHHGQNNKFAGSTPSFTPTQGTFTTPQQTSALPSEKISSPSPTPTKATVTGFQNTNGNQVPVSTEKISSPSPTPTKATVTGFQNTNGNQVPVSTENTHSITSTQGPFLGSEYSNQGQWPVITGNAQSFAQSHAVSFGSFDREEGYNSLDNGNAPPFSTTQKSLTDILDTKNEHKSFDAGNSHSFSPSLHSSTESFNRPKEYTPLFTTEKNFPSSRANPIDANQENINSFNSFSQSFASANSFVSDEGFSRPEVVQITTPVTPSSTTTAIRKASEMGIASTTAKAISTTTMRLVYTPTVPQTTARHTTTTSTTVTPPRPSVSIPTATTPNPAIFIHKSTAYTPRPTTSAPQKTTYAPNPARIPFNVTPGRTNGQSTSKTPKGHFITYAPPTRATPTVKQVPQKDEAPSFYTPPKSSYLPPSTASTATPPRPSYLPPSTASTATPPRPSYLPPSTVSTASPPRTSYLPPSTVSTEIHSNPSNQPTRPSIPDSYFRSSSTQFKTNRPVVSDSPPFLVKSIPIQFNSSAFLLSPHASVEYKPPQPTSYIPPPKASPGTEGRTNSNVLTIASKQTHDSKTTTEPSFVIQKSVELFAAHEVALHPSVYSQSPYRDHSTFQNDYRTKLGNTQVLQPPPFLVPSPHARGFGRWNSEDVNEKKINPILS